MRFLPVVLVALALTGCEKKPLAPMMVIFEDRPCIGNNGVSPEIVEKALDDGDVDVKEMKVPEGGFKPNDCKGCYPSCFTAMPFTVMVPKDELDKARAIVAKIKVDLPSKPVSSTKAP